jgi:hypothetical protein
MTKFVLHCSPGDPWYIGFTDRNGKSRFLPDRRKFFGHWKTTNCPTDVNGRVVIVSDGRSERLTPDEALENFKMRYNSVEEYLGWLND